MMDVFFIILWIVCFLLIGTGVFFKARSVAKLRRPSDRILNYRLFPYSFLYKIESSPAEVITCLRSHNINDPLNYSFDEATMEIAFTDELASCRFVLTFHQLDDFWALKLTCPDPSLKQPLFLQMNPFWRIKVGAEPLPVSKYDI